MAGAVISSVGSASLTMVSVESVLLTDVSLTTYHLPDNVSMLKITVNEGSVVNSDVISLGDVMAVNGQTNSIGL